MVKGAGRGWRLSREGDISLVGDSHWEPDDPPGLDLPVCLLQPIIPLFSGQSQVFSSQMFLCRQNASSGLTRVRKRVHLRNKLSCKFSNLDTKEGKTTCTKAAGWSACH